MNALIQSLVQANFAPERIIPQAPMSRYTTFRTGGPADVLVQIASAKEVGVVLGAAKRAGVPVTVIGNGSNLLVRDGGIRGLVLRISNAFSAIEREDDRLYVQSGASLSACAQFAQREGLTGLEAIGGIPGTVGGGAVMNAGAYGGEMSQVVTKVSAVSALSGHVITFEGDELAFGYRSSAMMRADVIITDVVMQLSPGNPDAIRLRMEEFARARREKQPLEFPSAGSTFKRPEGYFAAKLIDDCGLRGLSVGGAQVSEKHAGFIINTGSATSSDILALMEQVAARVYDATGVTLEPEVRILGEDSRD